MSVATFDTLKFANTLKAAGVPSEQAEAQAIAFSEALSVNFQELVTKDDLKAELTGVKAELRFEIRESEQRLNAKIDSVAQKLDAKIDSSIADVKSDLKLVKWMLGAVIPPSLAILIRLFFGRPI